MLDHQELQVMLQHRGQDDFNTNPLMKRERERDTLGQPFAIQSLVSTMRERVGA